MRADQAGSSDDADGHGDRIYLDHAAATPLRPEVAEVMAETAGVAFANPSSPHAAGRLAKRVLEEAREQILSLVGGRMAGPHRDRLVFTSGATEANRLGVLGSATATRGLVAGSARDHASLREAVADLGRRGWHHLDLPLAATGGIRVDAAGEAFATAGATTCLLTITTICGQTGIRDDLPSIRSLARSLPSLLIHADATQQAGWDSLAFSESPFSTLTLAAHKFGGPRGIGGLVIRGGIAVQPLTPGPQELGLRGGSEAVAAAAGFARALELAVAERDAAAARVAALRIRFEKELLAAAAATGLEATVVGSDAPRAPHVAAIGIAGIDRQAFVMAADLEGVCLATGTACASGSSEPPAVLAALGVSQTLREGVVRISLGRTTTDEEIRRAVRRLEAVVSRFSG